MLHPPRYLLREHVVLEVLEGLGGRSVAEIGCGAGEILVTLGQHGYEGVGYDPATQAREHAKKRLSEVGSPFRIVDDWPSGGFDVVLLLEVLGYLDDPLSVLERCRKLVKPGGHLVLSYARVGAGYDPKVVAGMRLLEKAEVSHLLSQSGFSEVRQVNYGFPLANLLVGVNNKVHRLRLALHGGKHSVGDTGLAHTWSALKPLSLISNRVALAPFFAVQRLFAASDLGNGYVVSAKATE